MISKDDIKAILAGSRSMALPADVDDDIELAMDSFAMIELQAALEDRYGVLLDPSFEDMRLLTSINGIHEYLSRYFPDKVLP